MDLLVPDEYVLFAVLEDGSFVYTRDAAASLRLGLVEAVRDPAGDDHLRSVLG